jgi:phosphate uptake regulator
MSETRLDKHEVRKLQITGDSTYILSLPKKWVTKMGLQKGNPVTLITQDDNSLTIVAGEAQEKDEQIEATLQVEATDDPDTIMRRIISLYLIGYNVIYVREEKERLTVSQRNVIKDATRKMLVGTEIIADSHNELMLKVLLSYSELSVQSALRRMSAIASSMHRDAMVALKELDKELASSVVDTDDEVDRFSLYIIRQVKAAVGDVSVLRAIGLSSGREVLAYRLITKFVERTADHAVEIAKNIHMLKHPLDSSLFKKISSASLAAVSVFDEAVESLFKRDYLYAEKTVQKAKQIASFKKELMKSMLAETHAEEVSSLTLMVESIARAAEYASDIAEIVMNLTVEQVIVPEKKPFPE